MTKTSGMFTLIKHKARELLIAGALLTMQGAEAGAIETNKILFAENFQNSLEGRWRQLKFGASTDYVIVGTATNTFLQATANKSCSALMTEVKIEPKNRIIARWCWKIDHVPTNSTDHIARSFDHTARVIIAFDTLIGPPRTVNYLWANQEKIGAILPHPLSSRAQMLVLESGNERAGQWIAEERDVTADWHRMFGDKEMPAIVAVGVITDSENTGSQVKGCYRNLELCSE